MKNFNEGKFEKSAPGHDGGTRKGLAGLRIRDAEEERRERRVEADSIMIIPRMKFTADHHARSR